MRTSPGQARSTGSWRGSTRGIDWLLTEPGEEERFILLGDSAGLTREDIEEKVRRAESTVKVAVAMSSGSLELTDILYLMEENAVLRQEIAQIEQRLSELEERMPQEKVIVLREISKEEAKEQIRHLFSSGRTLYYSDIAEELALDLELVVDICHEMRQSRELTIDESALRA